MVMSIPMRTSPATTVWVVAFLLSDSFIFGGLLIMRFNLLGLTRPHLDQVLGLAVTAVLLISSFFMNRAETSMNHGDRKGFVLNIIITLVMGIGFFTWSGWC